MTLHDDLKEWNDAIKEGEELRDKLRRDAMRKRDGWQRRILLRLADFTARWVDRGKRWRNADIFGENE